MHQIRILNKGQTACASSLTFKMGGLCPLTTPTPLKSKYGLQLVEHSDSCDVEYQ